MKRFATLVAALAVAACGPSVKTVSVEPASTALDAKGATVVLRAVGKDSDGKPVDMAKQKVAWTTSDEGVASVDASGTVTAKRSGTASIGAAVGSAKGNAQVVVAIPASVTVSPATLDLPTDRTGTLTAAVVDDTGAPFTARPVVWSSSDPAVASVADGKVVAVGPGAATVTAAVGTLRATAQVTVRVPDFARLAVTPAKTQLKVKDALTLKAAAFDKAGRKVGGIPVTWKSSSPQIVSVGPDGQIRALKKGQAKITATAGKKTATATITVADAPSRAKPAAKTTTKSKAKPKR